MCEADRQGQLRLTLSSNLAVLRSCGAPPRSPAHMPGIWKGGHIRDTIGLTNSAYGKDVGGDRSGVQYRTGMLEAPSQQKASPRADVPDELCRSRLSSAR